MAKRKDGLFLVQANLGGKRYSFYGKTKREAEAKRAEARKAYEVGLTRLTDRQTVGQYLETWLDGVKVQVRPRTYERYGSMVRYLLRSLASIALQKLTAQHVQSAYADLAKSGLSNNTVRMHHAMLHHALSDALEMGLAVRNVTEMVKPPRKEHREMQVLTADQVRLFLSHVADDRLYALYLLAFTTGMREGELLGLCWRHVHLKEGTVTIVQAAQRQRSSDPASALKTQIVFSEVKTGNSRRTIRLYSRVGEALKAHPTRQKVERLEAGRYWMDRDLVFCTLFGDFLRPEEVWRYFKKHLKEAGLPARRFHGFRHTAITLMLEQEVNPLLVSAIAGHHSKEFTMSVYGHVTPQMEKHGHERMEAFFGEAQ